MKKLCSCIHYYWNGDRNLKFNWTRNKKSLIMRFPNTYSWSNQGKMTLASFHSSNNAQPRTKQLWSCPEHLTFAYHFNMTIFIALSDFRQSSVWELFWVAMSDLDIQRSPSKHTLKNRRFAFPQGVISPVDAGVFRRWYCYLHIKHPVSQRCSEMQRERMQIFTNIRFH